MIRPTNDARIAHPLPVRNELGIALVPSDCGPSEAECLSRTRHRTPIDLALIRGNVDTLYKRVWHIPLVAL